MPLVELEALHPPATFLQVVPGVAGKAAVRLPGYFFSRTQGYVLHAFFALEDYLSREHGNGTVKRLAKPLYHFKPRAAVLRREHGC